MTTATAATATATNVVPGPGHNSGDQLAGLRDELSVAAAPFVERGAELLAACDRAPAEIDSDDVAGRFADLMKQIGACMKAADEIRVSRKEPFLAGGRLVDAVFKQITEPLDKAKAKLNRVLTAYQRRKADEERRAREAAEREAREAAARAAEAARQREQAMQTEADLEAAIAAEQEAERAKADAIEAQREADAKAAELHRARGDMGGLASLRTTWVGEIVDRDALDLEALRPHIPLDALEKAVRSFVRAGGRSLKGARIYEQQTSVVR